MLPRSPPHTAGPFMSERGRRFMDRLFSSPPLAHHPDCACYDAHVLRCGPFVLCLGCTCMAVGAVVAVALLACAWSRGLGPAAGWVGALAGLTAGLALYAPTLFQPFCQRKPFKILARFMLGAAVVVLGAAGLALPPIEVPGVVFRVAFAAVFWIVFKATLRQRALFTPDPCARCRPAVYPFCAGNRDKVALILDDLRRSAEPADAEFVAFAAALAGDPLSGATVEVTTLHALGHPAAKRCHGA